MKPAQTILLLATLLALLLGSGMQALALTPIAPPIDSASVETSGEAVPQWVPSGATPGFYAARDWRDLDPTLHGLVGGHQSFYWDQLNPAEGVYDWSPIEAFLAKEQDNGKKGAFGIITFNARANEGNDADPPLRSPEWVFTAGAQKVECDGEPDAYDPSDPRHASPPAFEIPAYWDAIYQAKYDLFVAALAQQFDGDPRVEYIQIGVGKFGETEPCDGQDDACLLEAWQDVDPGASQYTWGDVTVKAITAIYDSHFSTTPLLLPHAPTFMGDSGGRRKWTDDAIAKGVGLFPAGLLAIQEGVDYRTKPGWDGIGIFDRILTHIETYEAGAGPEAWIRVAQEAYNYMTPTAIEYYWAVLGALRRRVDYVTVEYSLLYDGSGAPRAEFSEFVSIMKWASQYMGKPFSETPSAWIALREAGYKDNWYPQKGNYSWWLYQDDNVDGGETVATTYRSKPDLVHPWDYADYGEAATVRAEIETDQAFLGPSPEGWICRRTDLSSGNRYMAFMIDDRYAYDETYRATITVTYLDHGTDSWDLIYDAVGNANKVAGTIQKTGTDTWKKASFEVYDGLFANRQSDGSDLRIDAGTGNEYIHMVDVKIEPPIALYLPIVIR